MRRNKEQLFIATSATREIMKSDLGPTKFNYRDIRMPSARHSVSEYQIDHGVCSVDGMTCLAQRIHNFAAIQGDFEPLQSETLTRPLLVQLKP